MIFLVLLVPLSSWWCLLPVIAGFAAGGGGIAPPLGLHSHIVFNILILWGFCFGIPCRLGGIAAADTVLPRRRAALLFAKGVPRALGVLYKTVIFVFFCFGALTEGGVRISY